MRDCAIQFDRAPELKHQYIDNLNLGTTTRVQGQDVGAKPESSLCPRRINSRCENCYGRGKGEKVILSSELNAIS
jgi:hypothetical protein